MSQPVTMQRVADAAGVSRMTVSLALRNSPRISEGTRRRVQALAVSLGYRPDPLIQRLATRLGQSRRERDGQVIAWVTAWKERNGWKKYPAFCAAYEGALARAEKLGYRLEEFWLRQPGMTARRLSRILHQRGIECVLIAPLPKGGGHLTLEWERFSLVALGYSMVAPRVNRVVNHQLHSAREAIRQLYRRGYRRIGLCVLQEQNARVDHSWLEAIAYHQFQSPASDRVQPLVQSVWNAKEAQRWLKKERPDSLLVQGSWIREFLVKEGYSVPGDIAVALLDWPDRAQDMAGINQRIDVVGAAAVDLVVSQAYHHEKGLPAAPRTVMVEGIWIDGATVAKA